MPPLTGLVIILDGDSTKLPRRRRWNQQNPPRQPEYPDLPSPTKTMLGRNEAVYILFGGNRARMKKCTYCGRKFPDEAMVCTIDQNALVACTVPSTFGTLSIAAPFIGWIGVLFCPSRYQSPEVVSLIIAIAALSGLISVLLAWYRHEPYLALRWIGVFFNLVAIIIAGALLLPGGGC